MTSDLRPERVRLILLDTHVLFRASLARFLAAEGDLDVTATSGTSKEALTLIRSNAVDVVVLEIALGDESGITFLSDARQQGFEGRFLILTSGIGAVEAARVLKLGASGIFLKSDKPERLISVVRMVARGEIWIDPAVVQLLAERIIDPYFESADQLVAMSLRDRERKVLRGIISGLSNRRIGEGMSLSESSVKSVVQRLFARAGVRTRSQLVRMALEGSLGQSDDNRSIIRC